MTPNPSRPPVFLLLNRAFTIILREHKTVLPLMAAYAWLSVVGARLVWPFLPEPEPNATTTAPYLIAELSHNLVLYGFALGLGVLWARALLLSPDQAWTGGGRAFLQRWGRMLGHFGATALAGIIILLSSVLISAIIGNIAYMLIGKLAGILQVPLMLAVMMPPLFLVLGALWTSLLFEAMDQRLANQQALRFVFHNWRLILPIMAIVIIGNVGLSFVILVLAGAGAAFVPTSISGTIAVACAGFMEFGFIILAITSLALLLPTASTHSKRG